MSSISLPNTVTLKMRYINQEWFSVDGIFSIYTIFYTLLDLSSPKGRTIRYLRGGLGNFSVHEFFFIPQLLARIFFSATFLCTIFFLK